MRRFGVLFCFDGEDGEDASARAWVVAWTPASAKSASARTPTSLRGVVVRRSQVSEARDAGRRVSSSRRVRRVGFAGRAFGGGEDACVLESLDLRASRGVNPGTQRRRARVIDASSRRFSKTARTLRGPRLRSRRAASRACSRLPCLCHRNHPWRSRTRGLPRASSSPRGTRARVSAAFPLHVQRNLGTKLFLPPAGDPSSVSLLPRQTLALRHSHSRRVSSGTPLVVNMNPAMIARNPVVVATPARPRVAARRPSAAAVRQADGIVSRASVGSARRATRCAASESEADKTVSALDAILAGSQDEPAPEEVRQRVSEPQRALTRSRSRATPIRGHAYTTPRLFFVSRVGARVLRFWKAALLLCAAFAVGAPRSATARV